jgi:hypothetical protein
MERLKSDRFTADWIAASQFLEAIREDVRITPVHISLFLAIVSYRGSGRAGDKVHAFSHDLMPAAKISSARTYHRCIRELHDFGYIQYTPSFDRFQGSEILLLTGKSV